MKLVPSDPDVETLVKRIHRKDLDLQPDFQRGEVWSTHKRQKLIDSILRGWHVPPIHVVEPSDRDVQEVLDGQQRLRSIYEFAQDHFPVDGKIEPADDRIRSVHGATYSTLPQQMRRAFNNFTIRLFTITDYRPEEPAELFYRLNQPVSLTAAETRNAFIGEARSQIRAMAREMEAMGYSRETIGFSNARMAYDDVLARLCLSCERDSIANIISAVDLAQRYRSGEPFSPKVLSAVHTSLQKLSEAFTISNRIRINKAGLFSWLWFIDESVRWLGDYGVELFPDVVLDFEAKHSVFVNETRFATEEAELYLDPSNAIFTLYHDRVTSRVANVASVAGRNLALWAFVLKSSVLLVAEPSSEIDRRKSVITFKLAEELLVASSLAAQDRIVDHYIHELRRHS